MSIPKIIHYCWFGKNPLPELAEKCIRSWKKFCPDYKIIQWDETNFDVSSNLYARQAYEAKKWAFVSDYARLKMVYDHGGIYLDTDVELIKPLDEVIAKYDAFFGYENEKNVATGLGFGAEKHNNLVKAMLDSYDEIPFIREDGSFDMTPCPNRNTEVLRQYGLNPDVRNQVIDNACFFAKEYLCPMDFFSGKKKITSNTLSIHHYSASWCNDVTKRTTRLKRLIGVRNYDFLYAKFLHKSKRWEW